MSKQPKRELSFALIRKQRGMCLEGAAAMLNISSRYLRRLETGKAILSWTLAQGMCGLYNVTLAELIRSRED